MPPDSYDAGPEDGGDASALDLWRDARSDAHVDAETDARASDAEIEPDDADARTGSSDAADSSTVASDAAGD